MTLETSVKLNKNYVLNTIVFTNRSVSLIRLFRLRDGVKINVYNLIQVTSDDFRDRFKFFEVERFLIGIDEHVNGDGCQIAHSNFIRAGVLDDFSAQVTAFNRA